MEWIEKLTSQDVRCKGIKDLKGKCGMEDAKLIGMRVMNIFDLFIFYFFYLLVAVFALTNINTNINITPSSEK